MKIALHHIAYKIGIHPTELGQAVRDGELTGELPDNNPQSKDAWVDILSLRNYVEWLREKGKMEESRFLKAVRHIDNETRRLKGRA
ncbi:hypothetical protein [Brevibacillus dissolubilis]|uniref:hypothetical protein n=1 Tax=Brevibacillus dissolubilis TaxID=1844116 RepID=UPI00111727D7|nr:hypothetical protein [Brevibacillus dissolubilis]